MPKNYRSESTPPRSLREILEIHGFSNIKVHGYGFFPFGRVLGRVLSKIDPLHSMTIVAIAEKS